MTAEKARLTSRRQALRLGGAVGGLAAAAPLLGTVSSSAAEAATSSSAGLPVKLIEQIIEVQGMVTDGVLQIEIDRDDIPDVHKKGVRIKPAFEINGTACFQALSDGSVMLNGDMAFKAEELNPAIDQMLKHGLCGRRCTSTYGACSRWSGSCISAAGTAPVIWPRRCARCSASPRRHCRRHRPSTRRHHSTPSGCRTSSASTPRARQV